MHLALGVGLVAFGLAELAWFVRANARRSFAVQAGMFGELGVMFVLIAIFPEGPARIAVSVLGVLAVGSSAILQIKLLREERRERTENG
jgi:hypothetical protein